MQKGIWLAEQLGAIGQAYTRVVAYRLKGDLSIENIRLSVAGLVDRHQSLRARIDIHGGSSAAQFVGRIGEFNLDVVEIDETQSASRKSDWREFLARFVARKFDLRTGPLFRAVLVRVSDDEHILAMTAHHIVCDGWSLRRVLPQELGRLYRASMGLESHPPDLDLQFPEYAKLQQQNFSEEKISHQIEYWRQQLEGIREMELPFDRSRGTSRCHKGSSVPIELNAPLLEKLRDLARRQRVTMFMLLLAAFKLLIARWSKQEDVIVGAPISERNTAELEQLIGCVLNTLVLRTKISEELSFLALLSRVRRVALDAYANRDLPFSEMPAVLQINRDTSLRPLVQMAFSLQSGVAKHLELPNISVSSIEQDVGYTEFDLSLNLSEKDAAIVGTMEYRTSLFDRETIVRLGSRFLNLLSEIVEDPSRCIAEYSIVSSAEQALIHGWSRPNLEAAKALRVTEALRRSVMRRANAEALVCREQSLNYSQLDVASSQFANYLLRIGLVKGSFIGVCLGRCLDMVITVLGIMKLGATYVPLDPVLPDARAKAIIRDAVLDAVVTVRSFEPKIANFNGVVVVLDSEDASIANESKSFPICEVNDDDLAYVIYTSGTTGEPKGVCVTNAALANVLECMRVRLEIDERDRILALTSLAFDISGLEMFLPLIVGGCVVIADDHDVKDGHRIVMLATEKRITALQATPSTWQLILEDELPLPPNLKILCGGEELSRQLADRLLERSSVVWNLYGPSETTIWSTLFRVTADAGVVPIGRPIANTKVYVLDNRLETVPVGVTGELYIGGIGLARGYLNNPRLTAEKFVSDPFGSCGSRLYRTGDLVRFRTDGNLEFIGRIDSQRKVRGNRVELGEIESALLDCPEVSQAVALLENTSSQQIQLGAYVVAVGDASVDCDELRRDLAKLLPNYMVPSVIVQLDRLPTTISGKLDRKALPGFGKRALEPDQYEEPRDEDERCVAQLWCQVLGLDRVCINDNFFSLGGNSLLAMKLVSKIRRELGVDLSVRHVFDSPTVAQLAADLREASRRLVRSEKALENLEFESDETVTQMLNDLLSRGRGNA